MRYFQEGQHRESALQEEMSTMRSILEQNRYITVLIDGDSLTFSKDLLKRGEKGGFEAAQAISEAVKTFAAASLAQPDSLKICIKLCANIKALIDTFARFKWVDKATFEECLRGLSNSNIVFDIVDTSLANGSASKKIKESYRHDFLNIHCHQIFLAALANNELDALLDENPDMPSHERVILLEAQGLGPNDRFNQGLQTISLNTILTKVPIEPSMKIPPTKIATPVLARIESNSSSRTFHSRPPSAASTPNLTWAAMTAQPFVPKSNETNSGASTPPPTKDAPTAKATPSSVPRNKYGQRVDAVDNTVPYQELQRIKKMKLCNVYYLQGKTACNGGCNHSHTYPISSHEKKILREVARMTPCRNRLDCDDPGCIYGHRCPQSKPDKKDCFYKSDCRFIGWGHGIDEKVVKTHNIK